MNPRTKREYLKNLVAEKNRTQEPVNTAEKAKGFRGWHSRGYLPHFDKPNTIQFVTFRLIDSMPAELRHEWAHLLTIDDEREKRTRIEDYLDSGHGVCQLRNREIASLAQTALLHSDGKDYGVLAWVIMPNHVHALVEVWQRPLAKIVQSWKSFIAKQANQMLKQSGDFWQPDYYDRYIRDEEHLQKTIRYIDNNPVKARLVKEPAAWEFGSAYAQNTELELCAMKEASRPKKTAGGVLRQRAELELRAPIELAARVISHVTCEKPADAVLREALRGTSGLSRFAAGEVSRAVFAHYRWFGWLDSAKAIEQNIRTALDLTKQFAADPKRFSDEELLAKTIPGWVREEMNVSAAWTRTLQTEPKLWLRCKPGQREHLARALGDCFCPDFKALPDAVEFLGSEDLFRSPEFQNGDFELQDIASQAVSVVCSPQPGQTWWDACAGEGGKTLHFSALMQNKGLIWASDRAEWRLRKLKQRTARAKAFNYRAAQWDGGSKLPTKTKFDGILVDAPCSGVGTWQRNPHAKWTATAKDVHELAEIQKQLLSNVAGSLKPGGELFYSVCTLTRAETDDVASYFEQKFPQFTPLPMQNPFTRETATRLWFRPEECGGNGMFVAGWTLAGLTS